MYDAVKLFRDGSNFATMLPSPYPPITLTLNSLESEASFADTLKKVLPDPKEL